MDLRSRPTAWLWICFAVIVLELPWRPCLAQRLTGWREVSLEGGCTWRRSHGSHAARRSRPRLRCRLRRKDLRWDPIHFQMEDVRAVVVTGEVVPQLHAGADLQVAFGVENALLAPQWPCEHVAIGRDDQTAAAPARFRGVRVGVKG